MLLKKNRKSQDNLNQTGLTIEPIEPDRTQSTDCQAQLNLNRILHQFSDLVVV